MAQWKFLVMDMSNIKGITVVLHSRAQTGKDPFGNPIYEEKDINVENVLVEPITQSDVISETGLEGTNIAYRLCIPKGDMNDWENNRVSFFDKTFKVYGPVSEYIESNLPLEWNKKVLVEKYE